MFINIIFIFVYVLRDCMICSKLYGGIENIFDHLQTKTDNYFKKKTFPVFRTNDLNQKHSLRQQSSIIHNENKSIIQNNITMKGNISLPINTI